MHLTNVVQLALLVTTQISAAPVAEPGAQTLNTANELVKRADIKPVSCGPSTDERAWPLQSVQEAYDALVTNGRLPNPQKPKAGTRFYPREIGAGSNGPSEVEVLTALNAIPECKTGQNGMKYFEFPITDPVFAGGVQGSQGPDRVIAISPSPGQGGTRSFIYCLAVTHRGGTDPTDGSFRLCT